MIAIVLGMGLQGKAVIHDLEQSNLISKIFAADINLDNAETYLERMGYTKTEVLKLDISRDNDLSGTYSTLGIDIVICMLPIELALTAATAAMNAGIPFVSSNYTYQLQELDALAKEKGCIILPEMGLDPGIDLVLGRLAVDELDEVHGLYSYGGGIPAAECADDSPIRYKISWIFDRVLAVYTREARLFKGGRLHVVPGNEIFRPENVHEIEFPGIGMVEAYPNGDAERYVEIFGLGKELVEMGRFALRWPGHSKFWRKLVDLGLLADTPISVGGAQISPRSFITQLLTPRLQYTAEQQDLALLRVEAWGIKASRKIKVIYDLVDYRDLTTGLFAMNRTVGFTSSIGALMILSGEITGAGVLSPVRHVPPVTFLSEVKARGMHVDYRVEELD
ncbi:saccharopine dehydrogenase family protein [Geopsychrobacter electrodiphilus]|uniref:saccharopine dehydrogenase family protein n=1 Tax=Geopsychrobacter electrodiphilus TaxID=225196 RepID=UPI00036C7AEB|nr:saccharopine dehydrogenase C-terminal domain-containing protein [Geopsychrobacter electrodiphilus]